VLDIRGDHIFAFEFLGREIQAQGLDVVEVQRRGEREAGLGVVALAALRYVETQILQGIDEL
jgi:hypothetical protein